jgi:hypothetical protein
MIVIIDVKAPPKEQNNMTAPLQGVIHDQKGCIADYCLHYSHLNG